MRDIEIEPTPVSSRCPMSLAQTSSWLLYLRILKISSYWLLAFSLIENSAVTLTVFPLAARKAFSSLLAFQQFHCDILGYGFLYIYLSRNVWVFLKSVAWCLSVFLKIILRHYLLIYYFCPSRPSSPFIAPIIHILMFSLYILCLIFFLCVFYICYSHCSGIWSGYFFSLSSIC